MQLVTTSNEKLARAYAKELSQNEKIEQRDPFGKVLKRVEKDLESFATRVSLHDSFIREYYHQRLTRLANHYLDPIDASYSFRLSYEYTTSLYIQLSCDKITDALPVIRILCAEGLKIINRPAKGGESSTKTWIFEPRDLPESVEQKRIVRLVLHVSAKKCEQVQVGTREVPVYETRCDWGEEPVELEEGSEEE